MKALTIGTAVMGLMVLSQAAPREAAAREAPAQVVVSGAWSRPTSPGMTAGVVYLRIRNAGPAPDRLVGATTPAAAQMELHRTQLVGGVSTMRSAPGGLNIPVGESVALAPNGYHFMLVRLTAPLKAGARFPATLEFAHAGKVRIEVSVRAAAATPSMAGMKM